MAFPFTIPSGAYDIRQSGLKQGRSGHDVWALQRLFNQLGHSLVEDGVFGSQTDRSVRLWQEGRGLVVDGVAGPATQKSMVLVLAVPIRDINRLPTNALKGQLEHESGFLVGNHTARYPDNSFDGGVAQCNSRYHGRENQFDAEYSVGTLARQIRDRFDAYMPTGAIKQRLVDRGLPVPSVKRRWGLAQGSWNRPAYANYLAGRPMSESAEPSEAQKASLDAYIAKATRYIVTYPKA